jgi:hypothetical protein
MKLNFNFNWVPDRAGRGAPPGRRLAAAGGRTHNRLMPEALDVTCPCCSALLKVDPETGAVVWVDQKKQPAQDLDDLVSRVHSRRSVLDEKFARSVQQTRNQKDILEKKFEEARKRAALDPTKRPPNPFDNE